jgi:hypothetical protein
LQLDSRNLPGALTNAQRAAAPSRCVPVTAITPVQGEIDTSSVACSSVPTGRWRGLSAAQKLRREGGGGSVPREVRTGRWRSAALVAGSPASAVTICGRRLIAHKRIDRESGRPVARKNMVRKAFGVNVGCRLAARVSGIEWYLCVGADGGGSRWPNRLSAVAH